MLQKRCLQILTEAEKNAQIVLISPKKTPLHMHFINAQNRKIFHSFLYVLFNFNVVIFMRYCELVFFLIVSLFKKKKVHRMIAKNLPRKGSQIERSNFDIYKNKLNILLQKKLDAGDVQSVARVKKQIAEKKLFQHGSSQSEVFVRAFTFSI